MKRRPLSRREIMRLAGASLLTGAVGQLSLPAWAWSSKRMRKAKDPNIYDVVSSLGLTGSLVLALDAGASNSYNGTSQTWTDLSGAGNHYYRGLTSGATATDPTFNGVAGRLTTNDYFSSDGGDLFSPVAATTFDDGWHKDGALVTIVTVVFIPTTPNNVFRPICGNYNNTGSASSGLTIKDTNVLQWRIETGSATREFNWGGAVTSIDGAYAFIGLSVSENGGAAASFWNVNGATTTFNGNITSPSAANPGASLKIFQDGFSGTNCNASRIALFSAWNTNLSQANVTSIYTQLKKRFPSI